MASLLLSLGLGLEGLLLLAFAGPPHVATDDGTDAAPGAFPAPVEAGPDTPDASGGSPTQTPSAEAATASGDVPAPAVSSKRDPVAASSNSMATHPMQPPPVPAAGPVRTRLRFAGVGTAAHADVLPFSPPGAGAIGFELEAGGFYRRKPRLGSAFTLGVIPNSYDYFPRFVVAHRLYVRNLLLAKPDFRVESLTNFDAGLGAAISLPGIHLGVGWSTRLVFRDRFFLNLKPVSFEVTAPDFTTGLFVSARYGAALTMGTAF